MKLQMIERLITPFWIALDKERKGTLDKNDCGKLVGILAANQNVFDKQYFQ